MKPSEALKMAEELGIPVPEWGERVEPPAYVKADVPIAHKSDVGAVVYVETEEELDKAIKKLKEKFGAVIVQKAVKGDVEVLASMKVDRAFGKVLVLAAGGVYASLLKESLVTPCPFCKESFEIKLKETKLGKMFEYRKKLDLECVEGVMEKLCNAKAKTFEINPLLVSEEGCWAVDVKVWT